MKYVLRLQVMIEFTPPEWQNIFRIKTFDIYKWISFDIAAFISVNSNILIIKQIKFSGHLRSGGGEKGHCSEENLEALYRI